MATKDEVTKIEARTWLYGPDGASKLFEVGDEHPGKGWTDAPAEPPAEAEKPAE